MPMSGFSYLRDVNTWSTIVRLLLAMLFGGLIGITRLRKGRAAGFRTYMIVCMGATLAMILNQYLYLYNEELRLVLSQTTEVARTDVTRLGAQVINGVGFLGAGTILVTRTKEVKGVTTAAGLWASACMGLAIGAGFYECVAVGFVLMLLAFLSFTPLENKVMEVSRNMNCYIEIDDLANIQRVVDELLIDNVHIYDIEIEHDDEYGTDRIQTVFYLHLHHGCHHPQIITSLTKLDCVLAVEET